MECVICLEDITLDRMITSETPYKLVEIIHDTWPGLYRPMKKKYNDSKIEKQDDQRKQ
jgi:hypothetical protein